MSDLLQALGVPAEAAPLPDGWYTLAELVQRTGWGERRLRDTLRRWKEAGKLDVQRVRREALDGRLILSPAYRLKD